MNWGYKIVVVYVLFVVGMLTLVYKSTQQKVDLVSENYYEQEVKFQDQLNRTKNANESGNLVSITKTPNEIMLIHFPEKINDKECNGIISFFRPDDSKLDFNIPVNPVNNRQEISYKSLKKGFWKMKINWNVGTEKYYQEEKVYFN